MAGPDKAHAQAKQTTPEKSLYERLGGVFAIAAVVDHFSDAVVKNPIVGQKSKNPQLREWHTKNLGRLPGLKFMRTLWVCNVSGGPFQFTATKPGTTPLGLEEAHRDLRISPAEFDEVAAELGRTLDFFKVPKREKAEVLAAFAAHKDEVTAGYVAAKKTRLKHSLIPSLDNPAEPWPRDCQLTTEHAAFLLLRVLRSIMDYAKTLARTLQALKSECRAPRWAPSPIRIPQPARSPAGWVRSAAR